jgi:hypothetical protein
LDSHVRDARARLNFSEWPHNDPEKAAKKWRYIGDSVRDGGMPLPSYTQIHKAARLSEQQRNAMADWAEAEANRLKSLASAAP